MRVNIIGGALGWKKVPFDLEGECWGANAVPYYRPCTLACEIHDFDWSLKECISHQLREAGDVRNIKFLIKRGVKRFFGRKAARKRMAKLGIPLLSRKTYDDIPLSIAFPFEEIKKKFKTDYYTNVVDYMIAYALYKGYDDLHLYAIRMDQDFERIRKKPSVCFWLGVAIGTGASVTIHDYDEENRLLKTPTGLVYGYPEIKQEVHVGCL